MITLNKQHRGYDAYQKTNVEWLRNIPADWSIEPAFSLVRENEEMNENGEETNVLSLSYGNIINRDVSDNYGLLPESFNTYQIVNPENVILRLTDLQNDHESLRVGYANAKGIITSAYVGLIPGKRILGKYAYYLLHSFDLHKVFYSMGGGVRQGMNFADIKRMPFLVPSPEEQTTITSYLDEKCALIDRLIEGKKKQIEILEEQRSAIIDRAITKGLDESIEMKNSGVEWIGEIPKTWELRSLAKCLSSYADYRGKTPTKVDFGTFLVTARNIKNGTIDYEASQEYVSESEYSQIMGRGLPTKGDVLITTEAPLGEVAQIDNENVALAQRVIKLRGKEKFLSNDYLKFLLMSSKLQFGLYRLATGSTALGIKGSKLKQLYLFFPPYVDQIKLVDYIKSKTQKVEQRVAVINKIILFLREYKSSLISHVVTGKIKIPPTTDV